MVPGIAWVAEQAAWPALRWLCRRRHPGVLGRIFWDPRIVGDAIGTTPIFNWLLYGYGVPAASFWLAGHMLRRRADDVPAAHGRRRRHPVHRAAHRARGPPLPRPATLMAARARSPRPRSTSRCLLAVVIGLERLRLKSGSVIHDLGAHLLAAVVFIMIVFSLGVSVNPLFTGEPVGGPFINLILLGYGLPGGAGRHPRRRSPAARGLIGISATAAAAALGLALAYLSLEIRTPLSRPGPDRRRDLRRRAIHLLRGLARCSAWRCSPPASCAARSPCASPRPRW